MKGFFLVTIISAFFLQSFSQAIPDSDFENWNSFAKYNEPIGWTSSNPYVTGNFLNDTANVTKDTIDFHLGKSSAKLKTNPTTFFNFPGVLIAGSASINIGIGGVSIIPKGGFPDTNKAQVFTGYYKYYPANGDSCLIEAWLFRRNPSTHKRDTIASLKFVETDSVKTFSPFSINFNYKSGESPDSALIAITSSYDATNAKEGSTLWVDDLAFGGYNSVADIKKKKPLASLYPNPASDKMQIRTNLSEVARVNVFDILGKKIKSQKVSGEVITVSTEELHDGMYFYQLASKEDEVLVTGKFSVIK